MTADYLPQFIIGGAMKSGTSSLHSMLQQHSMVFMPDRELYIFDVDDYFEHANFNSIGRRGWLIHDFDGDPERYLSVYAKHYADSRPGELRGEDTTSYLTSRVAPRRIARFIPDVRLIFLLRDPVQRAYSHYWHLVRTGRAFWDFETTLHFMGQSILARGGYGEALSRYFHYFSQEQVKTVLFEDFATRTAEIVQDVCAFIGLENAYEELRPLRENAGRYPRCVSTRLLGNGLVKQYTMSQYASRPPASLGELKGSIPRRRRMAKLLRRASGLGQGASSRMRDETRQFLEAYYRRECLDVHTYLGMDRESLAQRWPWYRHE